MGKSKRLLVIFDSSSTALEVYSSARVLRDSINKYTADHVFINKDARWTRVYLRNYKKK